jgi:hypothetical protein
MDNRKERVPKGDLNLADIIWVDTSVAQRGQLCCNRLLIADALAREMRSQEPTSSPCTYAIETGGKDMCRRNLISSPPIRKGWQ